MHYHVYTLSVSFFAFVWIDLSISIFKQKKNIICVWIIQPVPHANACCTFSLNFTVALTVIFSTLDAIVEYEWSVFDVSLSITFWKRECIPLAVSVAVS